MELLIFRTLENILTISSISEYSDNESKYKILIQ